jgi:peptidoglycan/xylan/chitin deacetylase (PgdA/CDA1 family)
LIKLLDEPSGNWVVLTFDDGLISDYEIAFPALLETQQKATFFVTVENIGKPGYMNINQIRELADNGMEIGSHGLTHAYLVTMPESNARQEILRSRDLLQLCLGQNVDSFAPVGGHFTPWMFEAAKDAGYRVFASMVPGHTLINPSSRFHIIHRNHIQSHHDTSYISSIVGGKRLILLYNEIRYKILALPKRLLGLPNYDRLKHFVAGGKVE